MEIEIITQILSNFGISGITAIIAFAWLRKDKEYTELANRVTKALEENARANTELKDALQGNTRVISKLETTITTQIFTVLRDKKW